MKVHVEIYNSSLPQLERERVLVQKLRTKSSTDYTFTNVMRPREELPPQLRNICTAKLKRECMLAHNQIHASFLIQIKHRVLYIYKFMEISRQAVELAPKKSVQTRISIFNSQLHCA
jgi:hypothetical protein